jgi:hypothetical protein
LKALFCLTEFDAYNRFKIMTAMGDPQEGLAILDKLDRVSKSNPK